MPWRGPNEPGEFPTLGYDMGDWIESHVVIPDGYRQGDPFLLTDEMWRFLLHYYRIGFPDEAPQGTLWHYGGQLRRSQKWGKDPFGAAIILAEALGPARFDGWDSTGEPVGAPYPTPYIPCLGTSEEQTDNTFLPLLEMIRRGPLVNLPGMDAGQTRVVLPSGGKIEPVTASARARLGQRMTFATLTETHLWTLQAGYRRLAGAVKRNLAGMDGRWLELTNAWDPTEHSEAQVTNESRNPRVYIDTIAPNRVENLDDDDELYAELLRQYGDSARERGGWVNIRGRIMYDVRDTAHLEPDRRRFFLNEEVIGTAAFVDKVRWDLQARHEHLEPGTAIALGFDGAKYRDGTSLVASRLSDGRLFELATWIRPEHAGPDWKVPSLDVDTFVRDTFGAYTVAVMFCDPYRWQDYVDSWAVTFGENRVVEFPTNQEQRMDSAIERFTTAFADLAITHDNSDTLTEHVHNAVLVKGSRKKPRAGEDETLATHYLKMAKKAPGRLIDAAVAAVLAHEARAWALEHGLGGSTESVPLVSFR